MMFLGAENIITKLGHSAEENFSSIYSNVSGVTTSRISDFEAPMSRMEAFDLVKLMIDSINASLDLVDSERLKKSKVQLILSTTKGEVNALKINDTKTANLTGLLNKVQAEFDFIADFQLVSNACISGVMALIAGKSSLTHQDYDHVIVTGGDALSEFTLEGFKSFFALSEESCRPFDKKRKGINLGEGVATIIISQNRDIFQSSSFKFLAGTAANDANHISGPSRNGEGLYRSITRTLNSAKVSTDEVDFISAHGTGTIFNDEMESIAFDRAQLQTIPVNSLKGYFGHTFGGAGLIEVAICLQSMRNDMALASFGFLEKGVSGDINILKTHRNKTLNTVLKTASGFGGCNASIIIRK